MSLEGDGINDEFFYLVWCKNEFRQGPVLWLPDTIIYKCGSPVAWYFTSRKGQVLKKHRHHLLSVHIEESFNKYVRMRVCMYIALPLCAY